MQRLTWLSRVQAACFSTKGLFFIICSFLHNIILDSNGTSNWAYKPAYGGRFLPHLFWHVFADVKILDGSFKVRSSGQSDLTSEKVSIVLHWLNYRFETFSNMIKSTSTAFETVGLFESVIDKTVKTVWYFCCHFCSRNSPLDSTPVWAKIAKHLTVFILWRFQPIPTYWSKIWSLPCQGIYFSKKKMVDSEYKTSFRLTPLSSL